MKWFFLFVLLLFAILGNFVAFDTDVSKSLIRLVGGLAFNLLVVALFLIWKFSYFNRDQIYPNNKDLGISIMFLALGLGLFCLGLDSTLDNSCDNLYPSEKSRQRFYKLVIKAIVDFFNNQGQCYMIGIGFLLLGLYVETFAQTA